MTMPKRLHSQPTSQPREDLIDLMLALTGLTIHEALAITPRDILTSQPASKPVLPRYYWNGNPEDVCECYLDSSFNCQQYGCAGIPGEREYVRAIQAGEFDDFAAEQAERDELLDTLGVGGGYTFTDLVLENF